MNNYLKLFSKQINSFLPCNFYNAVQKIPQSLDMRQIRRYTEIMGTNLHERKILWN